MLLLHQVLIHSYHLFAGAAPVILVSFTGCFFTVNGLVAALESSDATESWDACFRNRKLQCKLGRPFNQALMLKEALEERGAAVCQSDRE